MQILGIHFLTYISIGSAIFLLIHIVFGYGFKFYDRTDWFDLALHFLISGLIITPLGLMLAQVLKASLLLNMLFAFCFAVTISTLWELVEFTSDTIFGTNMQRWKDSYMRFKRGGLIDSMTDILAGLLGTIVICLVVFILIII